MQGASAERPVAEQDDGDAELPDICIDRATPAAMLMLPPTTAWAPKKPEAGSARCPLPPLPRLVPDVLPSNSAITRLGSSPRASAGPIERPPVSNWS